MGIEPTSEAWEASILPLNYARPQLTLSNPLASCKDSKSFETTDERERAHVKP